MRLPRLLTSTSLLWLWAAPAFAQTGSSTSTDALREQIKEELRQELVEEIKAEIKSELATEGAVPGGVQEDTWAEEEWKWEEPVKPELNFLELDGYFRFRYDLFKNLALGLYDRETNTGPFSPGLAPPVPICVTDQACATRHIQDGQEQAGSTLAGANMRLRLEPTLNVSEDIKLKLQIDVLDNVVLGSNPEGFPKSLAVPLIAFAQTQLPPSDRVNALQDSIRVKRAWAEIMTPLGQLRLGRMGSNFGMGVLANDGAGLDHDFGDSVDRIMFATKIAGHYIVPGFDWAVSGPTSAVDTVPMGQPFDREQRDDVDQFLLAVVKRDKDQEIKEKLENDETVLNYGVYLVYRAQTFDSASYYAANDPKQQVASKGMIVRNAEAFIWSGWLKLIWRKLMIEMEGVGVVGSVGNSAVAGSFTDSDIPFDIVMYGGALRAEYKLLHDSLTIHFLTAVASGDPAPGWGAFPLSASSNNNGDWDGAQQLDGKLNNFRFDPDFVVDMILWRQLVGTLTDAWIIKPGVQYNLTEGLGARLDFIYSRAMWARSTPSGSFRYGEDREPNPNLGLEADLKLFYESEDGFHAWLQYGLFFPFAGLDRQVPESTRVLESEIAQTLQVMFGVTF
ncbi:MAG: TIGR04551 family protein [Deltaproteobacteria bacterium]|nr:TIGR04551 family protein [Deltaproteobacteria bacterium]